MAEHITVAPGYTARQILGISPAALAPDPDPEQKIRVEKFRPHDDRHARVRFVDNINRAYGLPTWVVLEPQYRTAFDEPATYTATSWHAALQLANQLTARAAGGAEPTC